MGGTSECFETQEQKLSLITNANCIDWKELATEHLDLHWNYIYIHQNYNANVEDKDQESEYRKLPSRATCK